MPIGTEDPPSIDDVPDVEEVTFEYSDSGIGFDFDNIGLLEFNLQNIGGIESCEFQIELGVTVLVGENATNRTSTLRGVGGAIGAETGTLRANTSSGAASVTVHTETETVTLEQTYTATSDGNVQSQFSHMEALGAAGAQTLDDFAMLLEDNPVRRVIRRDGDLYNILMRPVDTDVIETDIKMMQRAREKAESRIANIESDREKLPELKQRRDSVTDERDTVETELQRKREELESLQESTDGDESKADELTEQLQYYREERQQLSSKIGREERSIEALEEDKEQCAEELESISVDAGRLESVDEQIQQVKQQKRELDDTITSLSTLATQNKKVLSGGVEEFAVDTDTTDSLRESTRELTCWTCGTEVEQQRIQDRTERLQELANDKRQRVREYESELDDLRSERNEIQQQREKRQQLQSKLENIDDEIATRQQRIESLESEVAELDEDITELEAELEDLDEEDVDDERKLTLSQDIGELEARMKQLGSDLATVNDQIEEIEEKVDELPEMKDSVEKLSDLIKKRRGLKEEKENDLINRFNEQMDELLELLQYDNLARVWLEKRKRGDDTEFVLNITREDEESGEVYQDTVANLSESEREVVGLLAAVVGHTVHDVGDIMPIMVLDSLEAIDASRIGRLIEYLSDRTDFLIAALLEEDAAALPDEYTYDSLCS